MMLVRMAWRNIWRNKRRTRIVLTSVTVGIMASICYDSLGMGLVLRMLEVQIASHLGHVQIAAEGWHASPLVQSVLPDPRTAMEALDADVRVRAWSPRVVAQGLAASAASSTGVLITGIDPMSEALVTTIASSIVEGGYLRGRPHEIVIGRALAEKLDVGIGGKIVLMASRVDGKVGSDLYRVTGIFETFSRDFDRSFAYVSIPDAQELLNLGSRISTITVRLRNQADARAVAASLRQTLGHGTEALAYDELIPTLVMIVDMSKQSFAIVYILVGIALLFGIVNTMLMSVFERIHEFGVLMAMGMRPRSMFAMILVEALFIGIVGALMGLAAGLVVYIPLTHTGLDLSAFSAGLRAFGSGAVVYPVLTAEEVASVLIIIPLFTVLGAVIPAIKAARLEPVQAIRYV